MTMRCSICDIAHEETSRCPTDLEYERGYRSGFDRGSKESLTLLSDERRSVADLSQRLADAEEIVTSLLGAPCTWTFDLTHDKWDTSCGNAFQFFNEGDIGENGVRFCMYCGGSVKEAEQAGGGDERAKEVGR